MVPEFLKSWPACCTAEVDPCSELLPKGMGGGAALQGYISLEITGLAVRVVQFAPNIHCFVFQRVMVHIKSLNLMCLCFCPCSLSDSLTDTVCQGNSSNMEKVYHFGCVHPPCNWSCAEPPEVKRCYGGLETDRSFLPREKKKKAEEILLDTLENSIETSSRRGLHFLLIASQCHKRQGEYLPLPVTALSLGEGDINILSSVSQQ